MKVIECLDVQKSYRQTNALENITFQLSDQKITGLIGRNGAGKTTLLKMLGGFMEPTSGEMRVFERNPYNDLLVSANSILVDDAMSFPDSLNLGEILKVAPTFYNKWNEKLAKRLFDYFKLNPKLKHSNLSKGESATFNLIFGLSTRCELTMLDEPMNGMDEAVRTDFYRALLKDYISHPRSILISSHHLAEIEHLLEDILLVHQGRVVLHQPLDEIKDYAIGLQGKPEDIEKWTVGNEVYYSKQLDQERKYVVVKNTSALKKASVEGTIIHSLSASDVCKYITSDKREGIDDVFK